MTTEREAQGAVRQMISMGEGSDQQRVADAMREATWFLDDGMYSDFFASYGPDARRIARQCLAILKRLDP